jgi:hypothetical protein
MALPNPPSTPDASKLHYLVYDNVGVNAAAVWRSVKQITVNAEVTGVAHVGTHLAGATLGGTDAVVTSAGVDGTTLRVVHLDASGNTIIVDGGNSLTVDAPVGTPVNVQIGDGARTATVRDTGVSDSLNVSIVDASGNQITSFAAGNQYIEDVASTGAELGPLVMVIRQDTPTVTTSVSLDYTNLKSNAVGALWVSMTDLAGNTCMDEANDALRVNIVAGAGAGGTSQTDNAAFSPGVTAYTPMGGYYHTTRAALGVGNSGAIALNLNRGQYVTIEDTLGNAAGVYDLNSGAIAEWVLGAALRAFGPSASRPMGVFDGANWSNTNNGVMPVAGVFDDTATIVLIEDQAGSVRLTSARAMHMTMRDSVGDSCMDDANNALRVNIIAGAGSGGTSAADDSAFAVASQSGTPIMGLADETTPDSVDEGDTGVIRMTLARAMHVTLRDTVGDSCMDDTNNAARVVNVAALPAGTNNIGDVDIVTVPAPLNVVGTGTEAAALRVTIATDSTGVLSVDDNGGSLTVDGAVAATQSGAWNITAITTNITPGTAAGHLGKAEDQTHVSADVGVMALGVRTDFPINRSGADGDYEPPQISNGRVWVNQASTTTILSTNVSVGVTATTLPASALAGRQRLLIQNVGTASVFVGGAGVTTANGIEIQVFGNLSLDVSSTVSVSGIVASGTQNVRVLELA